jgi:hypothetical protein
MAQNQAAHGNRIVPRKSIPKDAKAHDENANLIAALTAAGAVPKKPYLTCKGIYDLGV